MTDKIDHAAARRAAKAAGYFECLLSRETMAELGICRALGRPSTILLRLLLEDLGPRLIKDGSV